MGMDIWTQYKYDTESSIAQSFLQEEINQQTRYRENVSFRCVTRKRIKESLLWGIPALVLLLIYLFADPMDRKPAGVIPIIALALIWLIRICRTGNHKAARYLAGKAVRSPDTDFSQLVAEDIREQKAGPAGTKLFHILLSVLMMLGSLAIPVADRASQIRVDGMVFKPYLAGCILVDYVGGPRTTDVVIPQQAEGLTVVAIDSGAFMNARKIRTVSIPDTVFTLGAEAFSGCTSLESIVIPENITAIRGNCFENCTSLKSVTLHDGITAIHGYAFRNCSSLEQITLPSGIDEIRGYCFENCTSLKSIEIPEGVTRIGAHAFMGCSSLSSVTVPGTVKEIGSSAFRLCPRLLEISIPEDCSVDERSFKESPTKVTRTTIFTDEQWDAIVQEADAKVVDIIYYLYDEAAGPDKLFCPGEAGRIVVADSEYFEEKIAPSMALQPLNGPAEVLACLEQMKEQGAETVEFAIHSALASQLCGETWFVGSYYTIDELIAQVEAMLTES